MIAKIKTGKFFRGAFQYNLKKIEEGKASFLYSSMFKMEHPSFKEMQAELLDISTMCPNVEKPVFHTSLNFSPKEHLDDELLKAVVDEYMRRLGYGNTPYAVFKHEDTSHQHVHILGINIENVNGKLKKINDSYQYHRSVYNSRAIEKEFGLVKAEEEKRKKEELGKLIPELKEYGEVATYEQLGNVASYITENFNFTNLGQLNGLLEKYNIACFKNQKKGKDYYKFTFKNPQSRKNIGVGGTPAQLGLTFSSMQLDKIMEENRQTRDADIRSAQEWRKELLGKYLFITHADLERYLSTKGMKKIGNGNYLDPQSKAIFSIEKLLPASFINAATLKKEYFTNITKSATEFRKLAGIFHESTMFKDIAIISGFKDFFAQIETHLTPVQNALLVDSFMRYKCSNIDKIIEKEHKKDVAFANKMLDYVARLDLSEKTAKMFLSEFNIHIGEGEVGVGNALDKVVHEIQNEELKSYHFNGMDKTKEWEKLDDKELELIRAAVNDKPCYAKASEIDWENVSPFIPQDYAERYELEETLGNSGDAIGDMTEPSQTQFTQYLSSKNEHLYKKKKKRKKGDDNEGQPKRKGRGKY